MVLTVAGSLGDSYRTKSSRGEVMANGSEWEAQLLAYPGQALLSCADSLP